MALHEIHCEDCRRILGDRFGHIHVWLDQYRRDFPIRPFLAYHRSFLHNSYGLKIVREKWGREGEDAAKIHLIRDFENCCPLCVDIIRYNEIDRICNKALLIGNAMVGMEPEPHRGVWETMKSENKGLIALMMEG